VLVPLHFQLKLGAHHLGQFAHFGAARTSLLQCDLPRVECSHLGCRFVTVGLLCRTFIGGKRRFTFAETSA